MPRKRFGQHFLEPAWCEKVVRAVGATHQDHLIEIGPGQGALTLPLAASGARVTAIEIDRHLVERLRGLAPSNLTVVEGDVLACWDSVLDEAGPPVRVVGNLPYNISSPVLLQILESGAAGRLLDATVMLQLEVAERLCAAPHTKVYGTLSVLASHVGRASVALRLPPGAFRPSPSVHSAVVRLEFPAARTAEGRMTSQMFRAFANFVRDVFSHRRKTLANAVRLARHVSTSTAQEAIAHARLHGMARPETLTAADFVRLQDALAKPGELDMP